MLKRLVFCFKLTILLWKGVFTLANQIYVDMYVALIIAQRRTIEQVPTHLQEAVRDDLASIGLDGNGQLGQ